MMFDWVKVDVLSSRLERSKVFSFIKLFFLLNDFFYGIYDGCGVLGMWYFID